MTGVSRQKIEYRPLQGNQKLRDRMFHDHRGSLHRKWHQFFAVVLDQSK